MTTTTTIIDWVIDKRDEGVDEGHANNNNPEDKHLVEQQHEACGVTDSTKAMVMSLQPDPVVRETMTEA